MSRSPGPTADDLRPLIRRGLPADELVSERLLGLAGVVARSAGPERASRVQAFNLLLRQMIARLPEAQTAQAAAILFADAPGTVGRTLTERRAGAASALSVHPDHFRKHLEPRILEQLAQTLAADSERMSAARVAPPQLVPVATPPAPLPEDMFVWEAIEHEEHLSRLWATVFALRADLLACERLASMDPAGQSLVDAAEAALWRWGQLQTAIRMYRRAYGARMLNGDVAPDRVAAMAGWCPPMDPAEVEIVCRHGPDSLSASNFLAALLTDPVGRRLRDRWVAALRVPHTTIETFGSAE